jgi:hypothetical protein
VGGAQTLVLPVEGLKTTTDNLRFLGKQKKILSKADFFLLLTLKFYLDDKQQKAKRS